MCIEIRKYIKGSHICFRFFFILIYYVFEVYMQIFDDKFFYFKVKCADVSYLKKS